MKRTLFSLFLVGSSLSLPVFAGTVVINPTSDFFTSPWAFGAPYVLDAGRDHLGISAINPFEMGESPSYEWEETTYLKFDISSLNLTSTVSSAILTFQTVARSGFPPDEAGFVISAHYLLSDPNTIDPSDATSFIDFKTNEIGNAIDSVVTTAFGTYTLDLTDLVNEWYLNGDANFDFGTALTGRIGNETSPDGWLAIVNSGYSGGPTLTVTTVPEVGSSLLFGAGVLLLIHKRRRA